MLAAAGVMAAPFQARSGPVRLSLDDRVRAQRAMEEVYAEGIEGRRSGAGIMIAPDEERRAMEGLLKSRALLTQYGIEITPAMLQAEIDRMARDSQNPARLAKLWAALNNDPLLIAECMARPLVADRLLRAAFDKDNRIHGAARAAAERELRTALHPADLSKTSGRFQKAVWVRESSLAGAARTGAERRGRLVLDEASWAGFEGQLALAFGVDRSALPVGRISPLNEDESRFFAVAILGRTSDTMTVASIVWPKRSFDDWWAATAPTIAPGPAEGDTAYSLPGLRAAFTCADDSWTALPAPPTARMGHSAVFLAGFMVIWGGTDGVGVLGTGAKYDPAADSWTPTTQSGAPAARQRHATATDGKQLAIWGGVGSGGAADYLNTGALYTPTTDTWVAFSTTSAPSARADTAMAYIGSPYGVFVVWGGAASGGDLGDGGLYSASAKNWQTMPTTGAPAARRYHTIVVTTGGQAIVWGGESGTTALDTGARLYYAAGWKWQATATSLQDADAPSARYFHTAVMSSQTGSVPPQMIVWGGTNGTGDLATGARYNPSGTPGNPGDWEPITSTGAPSARQQHTAVWDGSELIIWGGLDYYGSGSPALDTGAKYVPATGGGTWTAMAGTPPAARFGHQAVWGNWSGGSGMIVWGGKQSSISGSIVNSGGVYNPATNGWTATGDSNVPTERFYHTAVNAGGRMIVWGGQDAFSELSTGRIYEASNNSWTTISTGTNCPSARSLHSAVWTGSSMIVWGGTNKEQTALLDTGGTYTPGTPGNAGTWAVLGTAGALPYPRYDQKAVWASSLGTSGKMIVWGGWGCTDSSDPGTCTQDFLDTGGLYDLSGGSWTATNTAGAPTAREFFTSVWTGSKMVVWGGVDAVDVTNTGGVYDPSGSGSWAATSTGTNCPSARSDHSALWYNNGTNGRMVVWGGTDITLVDVNTGGKYDPVGDAWDALSGTGTPPQGRSLHGAVWTGRDMIVWGGLNFDSGVNLNTGGRFKDNSPGTETWTATTMANVPVARQDVSGVWLGAQAAFWGGYGGAAPLNSGGLYCACLTGPGLAGSPIPASSPTDPICASPVLSWTGDGTPNNYSVYLGGGTIGAMGPVTGCTGIASPQCAPGTLTASSTLYQWRVDSSNSCNTNPNTGDTWQFYFQPDPGAPTGPAPATLGEACDANPLALSWAAGADAGSYDVVLDSTSPPSTARCTGTASTTCNVSGLSAGGTYYWRVTAKNTCGTLRGMNAPGPEWSFYLLGTPAAPTVTDIAECASSGVTITWTELPGATGGYDLLDNSTTVAGVGTCTAGTCTYTPYVPGDNAAHTYAIRAKRGGLACAWGPTASGTDINNTPGKPVITGITDNNACGSGSVNITFSAGSGATSHDLWVDGSQAATSISSPFTYNPGNLAQHSYVVRARKTSCSNDSDPYLFTDVNDTPGQPSITGITDASTCTYAVQVNYTAGSGAASHNLHVDSVLAVTGYVSGATYAIGNGGNHTYMVKAIKNTCSTDSAPSAYQDTTNDTPGIPSITGISDTSGSCAFGIQVTFSGGAGATSFALLQDGNSVATGAGSPINYTPTDTASHNYTVRALKGTCATDSAPQAFADANTTPGTAPVITQTADVSACALSGITVTYTAGGGATRHDLYKDGGSVVTGYTSGATYAPGDTASHNYTIRAVNGSCFVDSNTMARADLSDTPGAPVISTIDDVDTCALSGIKVNFTPGTPAGTSYDLYRNSSRVVTGYTSGATYYPGSTGSATYYVRAVKGSCGANSNSVGADDANNTPGIPGISSITDADACALGGIRVNYSAGTNATSHNLLKDSVVVVTGYVSGSIYNPGDGLGHTYIVQAVNGTCTRNSGGSAFTDGDARPGAASITGVTDNNACAMTGLTITFTGGSGATSHDLWRDGVLVATNVTSPISRSPGNSDLHMYVIRAWAGTCYRDSAPGYGADLNGTPGQPLITGIVDVDPYNQSGIQVSFTPGGGAASHDLYKDGFLAAVGYMSGTTYNPGDTASHTYFVRAVNGACATDSAAQNFTDGDGAPNISNIADLDPCAQSGIRITYGDVGALHYDLFRDGVQVANNTVSPYDYNPGDTATHNYQVEADFGGGETSMSQVVAFSDDNGTPGTPSGVIITDDAACAQTGITITFTGGSGASSHSLMRDSVEVATGITSPYPYSPGDASSHSYQVRAISGTCHADSGSQTFADANATPGAPSITSIADVSACAQSGIKVYFTGGSGAARHDLYRNGALAVTGYTSGTTYNPGGTSSSQYMIRAVNGTCTTDSNEMSGTDVNLFVPQAGVPTVTDDDSCAQSGVHINWTDVTNATYYEVYVYETATTISPAVAPQAYNPATTSSRQYRIRGRNASCDGGWSGYTTRADNNLTVGAMPGAPVVADIDACALSGVAITRGTAGNAQSYDLLVDGSTIVSMALTNPYTYHPADSGPHTYAVRGANTFCTPGPWSGATSGTDTNQGIGSLSAPSVADADSCALSGVNLTWGTASNATTYDIYVDGITTISGVSSPYVYEPGDGSSHTYQVRGRNGSCTGSWSTGASGADVNNAPVAPVITSVTDVSSCAPSGVVITWGDVPGAIGYDLYVDATTIVPGVASPYTHIPGDANSHSYQVRSRNATCSGPWSVATAYANPGGTGDRTALITVSTTLTLHNQPASWLVAGSFANSLWWDAEAAAGKIIDFDFGAGVTKLINEAKFYQSGSDAHGVWQWQGSSNSIDWTAIGDAFTLGGVATQTLTALSANLASFRYYRLLGVSGSTSNLPYINQFEFKIGTGAAVAGADVDNTPAAPTAGNGGPACAGSTLSLTASTISGAAYAWTGPNGFTSALQNPSISNATTAATGTYSVTATVLGCTSPAGTTDATVNAIPGAPTAGNNGPVCAGSTLSLTASTIPGATYAWTGPNGFTSALQNPSISNATTAATGTYSVTATVLGCTSSAGTTSVTVNAIPAAPTAGNNGPLCTGDTLNLTASTVAGATYAWTGPNGFTSALQNPSIANATTAATGTYSVTATVLGCTSSAGTTSVTVTVCSGPPAAGDGAADGAQGNMASFIKAAGWDTTPIINVTYDTTRCPSSKTIILYGRMDPNGDGDLTDRDFTGYHACAQPDGGSGGSASFDSTGQSNAWYNIVWVSASGVAGHPGYARDTTLGVVARTWSAAGLCGATDIGTYLTCP